MEVNNTNKNSGDVFGKITNLIIILFVGFMMYYLVFGDGIKKSTDDYLKIEIKRLDSMNLRYDIALDSLKKREKQILIEKQTIIKQEIYEKEIVKNYNDSASVDFFIKYTNEYIRTSNK